MVARRSHASAAFDTLSVSPSGTGTPTCCINPMASTRPRPGPPADGGADKTPVVLAGPAGGRGTLVAGRGVVFGYCVVVSGLRHYAAVVLQCFGQVVDRAQYVLDPLV